MAALHTIMMMHRKESLMGGDSMHMQGKGGAKAKRGRQDTYNKTCSIISQIAAP